jgi:hypothetical protein
MADKNGSGGNMRSSVLKTSPLLLLLLAAACTTLPSGPSVLALPGSGKSFDQFRADDASCRQYAQFQMNGMSADQAAANSGLRSAAVGTLLGAVAGAAVNGGHGAGVGAGVGMAMGGLSGVGAANSASYGTQQRYDFAYTQCMYAQGHRVPVSGRFMAAPSSMSPSAGPGGPGYYRPPPPNTPPPRGY